MRISDLQFSDEMRENVWRGHSVELPKQDAHRMIGNEQHAQDFIDDNGDVEIVWDAHRLFTNDYNKSSFIEAHGDVEIVWNERYKYWEVPAFAEGRAAYGKAKQRACDTWGCE